MGDRARISVLLTALLVSLPSAALAQRATLRPTDQAVIRVIGVHRETAVSVGTGFFVDPSGLVVTAAHVVHDARALVGVSAVGGDPFRLAVLMLDTETDVAILQATGTTVPATLTVPGPLPAVVAGDQVSISGYSGDQMDERAPAISVGHVSRSLSDGSMELAASVNPGQSGGPVLSAAGELLGLVSARADPASGVIGVALIRPREEIASALAGIAPSPDIATAGPGTPLLSQLIAYRTGAFELGRLSAAEATSALDEARSAFEYAEALASIIAFTEAPLTAAADLVMMVRVRARSFTARYPQMFVLYPSLARATLD